MVLSEAAVEGGLQLDQRTVRALLSSAGEGV